jgi:hypothetical protein
MDVYRPLPQLSHAVAPVVDLKYPVMQRVQTEYPASGEKEPWAHARQLEPPCSDW